MSTVLSRLNVFLGSELGQVLCFDSATGAETFASQRPAIFLALPEEDSSKNFIACLMIQPLSRELFSMADEHGGKLPNRGACWPDARTIAGDVRFSRATVQRVYGISKAPDDP